MLFEGLAEKLQNTFKKLRGKGKLTETDISEALREVRLALLEADVSLPVVKQFTKSVRERCSCAEVLESLTPAQQIIKIVDEELTALMGDSESKVSFSSSGTTVFLLAGLQGSGKTTSAAKLALYFKKQGKRPLLVGADVYRPAAIKQLEVLAGQVQAAFFSLGEAADPVRIAREALPYARSQGCDLVIIDTAGRLHIDTELMDELKRIKEAVSPDEVFLVVDAMTGQDAVTVAGSFHSELELSGLIMTKLDGDARGGAALSVKAVTGCPIKFIGTGEKLEGLEPFHPDRMSSRILGMGDMLSLIEKAQASFNQDKALELQEKIRKQEFTLDDFVEQIKQLRNMGPLDQVLGMIPGLGNAKQLKKLEGEIDERELVYIEAMISSMTPDERRDPTLINGSRRRRIAAGSGTSVQDVNRFLKQYEQTRKMMRQFTEMGTGKKARKLKSMKFPF
jgi:signal recognition particle subunit SRP54